MALVAWSAFSLATPGLAAAPSRAAGAATPSAAAVAPGSRRAAGLLDRCRPVDLHADTLFQLRTGRAANLCADTRLQASAERLAAGRYDAQVFAIWTRPRRENGPAAARAALAAFDRGMRACPELVPALARDLAAAPGPRVRALLSIEGGEALGGSAEALRAFAGRGLFAVGPTWNRSNAFGDAALGKARHGGLSAVGQRLVRIAGELGVLVDVSHASAATARAILQSSRLPVIASHSNARKVLDHPRNLDDDLIRAIAASGGVIGVSFHCPHLVARGQPCDADAVARHVAHVRSVGGDAVLALGTDFDGEIEAPRGLAHAGDLGHLVDALLARGLPEAAVCGMLGENARRLMGRVVRAAP